MATKKEIRNYAEANGISREEARQHFINEAKNRKPKQIMVLPLEDNDLYKGKTVYEYITDNNIADCIVAGTIFDAHIGRVVEVSAIISETLDEKTALEMARSTYEFQRKNNPNSLIFTAWLPKNNFLDITINGTGCLRLGDPSGMAGSFLARLMELLGMTDLFKDGLKDAYNGNEGFRTALDNLNPTYKDYL